MKSCLLFFLALVAAIALAVLTESPKNGGLQVRNEVTYTEKERKGDTQPAEWATLERQEDRDAQSDNP